MGRATAIRRHASRLNGVEFLENRQLLTASPFLNFDVSLAGATHGDDTGVVIQSRDQIGDSFRRAYDVGVIAADKTISDRVGGNDPADVIRFTIIKKQIVTITLDRLSKDVDLHLFDSTGKTITRNNVSGPRAESIEADLKPGEYYALLLPRTGTPTNYRLSISAQEQEPAANPTLDEDAGDAFGRATNIGTLNELQRFWQSLGGTDSADVYQFQISQTKPFTATIDNLTDDFDLFIVQPGGARVGKGDLPGTTSETVSARIDAGTYYALILPDRSAVGGTYRLTLTTTNSGSAPDHNQPPPTNDPHLEDGRLREPLPSVGYFGGSREWNLNSINAPESWNAGYRGQGVIVAVLDTGVDRRHPDLQSNIWRNTREIAGDRIDNDRNGFIDDVYGWNFADSNNKTQDANAHGTHVAGIVAAVKNRVGATGVAPDAKIMPVRVLNATGFGHNRNVAQGVRYAVDNGADVINLSFIGGYSPHIFSAIQYANRYNVLVVAAAGNTSAATPGYPARYSASENNVISVGAFNSKYARSSFSNRVGRSHSIQVEAPGRSIYSTIPGNAYSYYKGTSMATPHVAGLAALALSAKPNLSAAQLRQVIVDGATRRISGSDAKGGINAAFTVPLAHNRPAAAAIVIEHADGESLRFAPRKKHFSPDASNVMVASLADRAIPSLPNSVVRVFEKSARGWKPKIHAKTTDFIFASGLGETIQPSVDHGLRI